MLKHIASVLGILYFVIGFQSIAYPFFTPHEISLVKETKVIEDPTLTYENLFSTYEFCQNGTWYLKKDSRGRAFVIFEANYLNKAFVQDYILELDKTNINLSNHIDKISKTIPNLEAKLISIFSLDASQKHIINMSTYLSINGVKKELSSISFLIKNNPVSIYNYLDLKRKIEFYTLKYIFSNIIKLQNKYTLNTAFKNGPIVISKVKNVDFDVTSDNITIYVEDILSNLTAEEVSPYNTPATVSDRYLSNILDKNAVKFYEKHITPYIFEKNILSVLIFKSTKNKCNLSIFFTNKDTLSIKIDYPENFFIATETLKKKKELKYITEFLPKHVIGKTLEGYVRYRNSGGCTVFKIIDDNHDLTTDELLSEVPESSLKCIKDIPESTKTKFHALFWENPDGTLTITDYSSLKCITTE